MIDVGCRWYDRARVAVILGLVSQKSWQFKMDFPVLYTIFLIGRDQVRFIFIDSCSFEEAHFQSTMKNDLIVSV